MSLSCDCNWGDADCDSYYYWPEDYSTLQTTRRKRCQSCNLLIDINSICSEFIRYRYPITDIELRIYDYDDAAEVWLASQYHCEHCADLWFTFHELGYDCIELDDNMNELLKEYQCLTNQ